MKHFFIKLGASLVLGVGILIFLALLALGIYFYAYPEALPEKRTLVGTGSLIVAIIILIISIAIFESMFELARVEDEIEPPGVKEKNNE